MTNKEAVKAYQELSDWHKSKAIWCVEHNKPHLQKLHASTAEAMLELKSVVEDWNKDVEPQN